MQVIDIGDPSRPQVLASLLMPTAARDVALTGDYAYVADSIFGLQVINIMDPENPGLSDENIADSLTLHYELDGNSKEAEIKDKKEPIPTVFSCVQNNPNPFVKSTIINYGLPKDSDVILTVFNLAGQAVKTLINGQQSAGFRSVSWDGTNNAGVQVPQGVYFYVFKAGDYTKHHKMILLK